VLAIGLHRSPEAPVAVVPPAQPVVAKRPFAIAHPAGESAFVLSNGRRAPITEGKELEPEEVVGTDTNAVSVDLARAKLDVESATEVVLPSASASQFVELRRGAVLAHVTKLEPEQRFVVRTPDAEVEVRGTLFRVAYALNGSCGLATEVKVTEGHVIVRARDGEHSLHGGESWKPACVPAAPSATPPPAPPPAPEAAPSRATSELARQNALFAEAMTAKRRGDPREAVRSLDELVEKHPSSPLREAAEAERMKLLAGVDPSRAASAARAYVTRYPNGFAVGDADAILQR
jgi:hypothetical protein